MSTKNLTSFDSNLHRSASSPHPSLIFHTLCVPILRIPPSIFPSQPKNVSPGLPINAIDTKQPSTDAPLQRLQRGIATSEHKASNHRRRTVCSIKFNSVRSGGDSKNLMRPRYAQRFIPSAIWSSPRIRRAYKLWLNPALRTLNTKLRDMICSGTVEPLARLASEART